MPGAPVCMVLEKTGADGKEHYPWVFELLNIRGIGESWRIACWVCLNVAASTFASSYQGICRLAQHLQCWKCYSTSCRPSWGAFLLWTLVADPTWFKCLLAWQENTEHHSLREFAASNGQPIMIIPYALGSSFCVFSLPLHIQQLLDKGPSVDDEGQACKALQGMTQHAEHAPECSTSGVLEACQSAMRCTL